MAKRDRKADKLAGKGSTSGNLKDRRTRQDNRLSEIMGGMDYDQSTGRKRK